MNIIILLLSLTLIRNSTALKFNWLNALPWRKDIPKEDYSNRINLHLIKKDWMPEGANALDKHDVTAEYTGSVDDVFKMFKNNEDIYASYNRPLEQAVELLTEENGYKKEWESIFIIHTISGDAQNYFVKNIATALALRNFMKRYNVFAFNMPGMQSSMEQTILKSIYGKETNYVGLSETIGKFFNSAIKNGLMYPNQIHLIGFCYSSQLSGYIARYISKMNNEQKIKSITALDPYSLGLSGLHTKVLSKNDAETVYVYHSNSAQFGTMYREGTADFNFNSGLTQPGCYLTTNIMCSHRRVVMLFWYVITYPSLWQATKCPNFVLFKMCICNKKEKISLTFPPKPGARGTYFLNTMSHKPYGYGAPGAYCRLRTKAKIKSMEEEKKRMEVKEKGKKEGKKNEKKE